MDDLYRFNQLRWNTLAGAHAVFSRPWLDLHRESASERIDPNRILGNLDGKEVLCLAGGGGQQSAAFGLSGARVTVLDISSTQLERDQEAARFYGLTIRTIPGDLRDLAAFDAQTFDVVSQPYSLNFVPGCRAVFQQVARMLRPGGIYTFWAANPFALGLGPRDWNGRGYTIDRAYREGELIQGEDPDWVFPDPAPHARPEPPREYRHLLSTLLNGLVDAGFTLLHLAEETGHSPVGDPVPGEWTHFTTVLPPWLSLWAKR